MTTEHHTGSLIGTRWRNKRTGRQYRVTEVGRRSGKWGKWQEDMAYLQCETKGGRSTWKYVGLLEWDYVRIEDPTLDRR